MDEIPAIQSAGPRSAELETWQANVKILLSSYYGDASAQYRRFEAIWFTPAFHYDGQPSSELIRGLDVGLAKAKPFLESRIQDLRDEYPKGKGFMSSRSSERNTDVLEAFVVHGHDDGTKEAVARFLEKLGLKPIILHEQADQGRTIIEKFESLASNVACAVVILTADDVGAAKSATPTLKPRARQNVILELGYFVGALGRNFTFTLVENGLEIPSDLHGLIYISLSNLDWRLRLAKEIRAAGIAIDASSML